MRKKRICVICFLMIVMLGTNGMTCAAEEIDTDPYKNIHSVPLDPKLATAGGKIVGVVQVVGTAVAVITLIIIGVKYMVSSPNDKAEMKSKMIPFVIGAVILFGASNLLSLVVNFVKEVVTRA